MIRKVALLILATLVAGVVYADSGTAERTIKILGRESVTVTTPTLRLADLAEVTSLNPRDDDTVIGLQKIYVDKSPAPGTEVTLSAGVILERLSAQGVDVAKLSYSLPRVITIKRAARPLLREEIRAAIDAGLHLAGLDVAIKDIRYPEDRLVSPGELKIEAMPLNPSAPGIRPFAITVSPQGEMPTRFEVQASVDEWNMMPVANRTVPRGSLIQADDVVMARVNLASVPSDALHHDREVIGLAANRDIPFGEVFRKDKLAVPPLITAGAKVTMMYRNGLFEASASGIALESGVRGQEIKVRNDSSKKVISAVILEEGLVGVKP
ncbi:MAG: flagellar basal body P-ring formation protein FlgA [Deltaproteobacteria bacterium]|nr:flagellar basal body P-ring formation protein FlgA [Deltaproteobacteria bacterium]